MRESVVSLVYGESNKTSSRQAVCCAAACLYPQYHSPASASSLRKVIRFQFARLQGRDRGGYGQTSNKLSSGESSKVGDWTVRFGPTRHSPFGRVSEQDLAEFCQSADESRPRFSTITWSNSLCDFNTSRTTQASSKFGVWYVSHDDSFDHSLSQVNLRSHCSSLYATGHDASCRVFPFQPP